MSRRYPVPANERERLAALLGYEVLDTNPDDIFDDFTRLASLICEAPTAMISLVDADRQWFKSRVGMDLTETPREDAFCAHAIMDPDEVMVVADALADSRFADKPLVTGPHQMRFYAGAPVVTAAGYAVGTVCVMDTVPRELSTTQVEALKILSVRVAAQLEMNKQVTGLEHQVLKQDGHRELLEQHQREMEMSQARLTREAETDALTGLANRRTLKLTLSNEFSHATWRAAKLSVVMIDVDHFKAFNDDFGHIAGDEVLVALAECISSASRGSDTVARYGGEEFIVVLPHTGTAGALVIAERIRRAVEASPWKHRPVTVSAGAATLDPHMESFVDLVNAADKALYEAKSAGRNVVCGRHDR
jgi:diguanylate cyclase (GGDEF)-like protein